MGITTVGMSYKIFPFARKSKVESKNFDSSISNFKEVVDKFILVNADDLSEKNEGIIQHFNAVEDRIISIITSKKFDKEEIEDECNL